MQARNCRTSSPEVDIEVSTAMTKSSIRFSSPSVSGGSTSGHVAVELEAISVEDVVEGVAVHRHHLPGHGELRRKVR